MVLLSVDVETTLAVDITPKESGTKDPSSCTNLTGRLERCVKHYVVSKEHPLVCKDESRDIRKGRSERNFTRTPDRKLFARGETVKDVFATSDHSRDERKEYPESAKKHSNVTNTEHITDLRTACGSDHHIKIAPEPALNLTGV